jgi:hypothetical protein
MSLEQIVERIMGTEGMARSKAAEMATEALARPVEPGRLDRRRPYSALSGYGRAAFGQDGKLYDGAGALLEDGLVEARADTGGGDGG